MYGQVNLRNELTRLVTSGKFPRFSIIVGPRGGGKKLIAKYIGKLLGTEVVSSDVGVDSVRSTIDNAYRWSGSDILYIFPDADNMYPAAKNAILKITEEPPRNAYFVMTLEDINNTLSTIRSRGQIFYLDPYSVDDIDGYYHDNYSSYADERRIVDDICTTPGEVDLLHSVGAVEFYEYVEKVVDNIAEVSDANSFKIANMLRFKESDDNTKYDLKLFFKAFMIICSNRLREDPLHYAPGISTTSKYLQELNITGINKQSLFDMWILDIRKVWM